MPLQMLDLEHLLEVPAQSRAALSKELNGPASSRDPCPHHQEGDARPRQGPAAVQTRRCSGVRGRRLDGRQEEDKAVAEGRSGWTFLVPSPRVVLPGICPLVGPCRGEPHMLLKAQS